ncbi:MAG: hypothetical protein HYR57_02845 [Candidatus Koribacter versatilis]|nr:hypothetical protein [Candidatus Koribacter versatilis]
MRIKKIITLLVTLAAIVSLAGLFSASTAQVSRQQNFQAPAAKFSTALAFDVSQPVRSLPLAVPQYSSPEEREIRPEGGIVAKDRGFSGDAARQLTVARPGQFGPVIPSPMLTFEGLSNLDNFNAYGFRVNPPDPVGDVGPNHYVEMINLVFNVYDKQGNSLIGATRLGDLWAGFAIADCTDPSGDPIVLYDHLTDRWLLSQFTTRGPIYYNCVAISQTGDPTGAYYRYAFSAGEFFPDYPKYGTWPKSYLLTSRDFGPNGEYGISVYALEKDKMNAGDPNARSVKFFLDYLVVPLNLIGDGLLPADTDGHHLPASNSPVPIVGTQDDNAAYGATFDALNIWELTIKWRTAGPKASLVLATQLPVEPFDSVFPCGVVPGSQPPSSRDCLPQPGITDGSRFLDILSYRQRPTWRLAYRKFSDHASMVTNQSVEAAPGMAGVRWYEIRRIEGVYSLYQQGTYAPDDGVHRWMGSIAMDRKGNMALGYSVTNATDVYPGIRYTGRLRKDPLGQMTLGEGVIVNGTGVQTTTNSRWGDYTSMNVDPNDDCTFWYVNEYYTLEGQLTSSAGWQTRIGSFRMPRCGGE